MYVQCLLKRVGPVSHKRKDIHGGGWSDKLNVMMVLGLSIQQTLESPGGIPPSWLMEDYLNYINWCRGTHLHCEWDQFLCRRWWSLEEGEHRHTFIALCFLYADMVWAVPPVFHCYLSGSDELHLHLGAGISPFSVKFPLAEYFILQQEKKLRPSRRLRAGSLSSFSIVLGAPQA